MTTQPNPIATVLYTPDGQPVYATVTPGPAAPLAVVPTHPARQPSVISGAASVPYYEPTPLPPMAVHAPAGYSPGRDPWVIRLLAGGIGLGAASVGLSFLFAALAAATTAIALLLGVLAVFWLLAHSGGSGRGGAVNLTVHNRMNNRNR